MSGESIARKAELVNFVSSQMKSAVSIIIVNSRGLTVDQDTKLRRELRENEVEYRVIKNSILRRAAEKSGFSELSGLFLGPSAIALSQNDVVASARIINNFSNVSDAIEIKGGVIEGNVVNKAEIIALATLPSREALVARLLSVLQTPIRNVWYSIQSIIERNKGVA